MQDDPDILAFVFATMLNHVIQQLKQALVRGLGNGLPDRQPDHLPVADEPLECVIGEGENMILAAQDRDHLRRLLEHAAEVRVLGEKRPMRFFGLPRALQNLNLGAGIAVGQDECLTQARHVGHIDGVLKHEARLAVARRQRRVNSGPEPALHAAALRSGFGNVIGDVGQRVAFPALENPLQRSAQPPAAFAVIGKHREKILSHQFVTATQGRFLVGLVDAHEIQLPIDHHVRTGQPVEQ